MSQKKELQSRVEARLKQLEADLAKARSDAHSASNDAEENIQSKVDELKAYLEEGWENWTEGAARKLNEFLK